NARGKLLKNTALINAARYCRYDNVRTLLRYEADVSAKDIHGETALTIAQGRRKAAYVEYDPIIALLKAHSRYAKPTERRPRVPSSGSLAGVKVGLSTIEELERRLGKGFAY